MDEAEARRIRVQAAVAASAAQGGEKTSRVAPGNSADYASELCLVGGPGHRRRPWCAATAAAAATYDGVAAAPRGGDDVSVPPRTGGGGWV